MKELSIEEKAKAYDEALERAKKVHKYSSDIAEIKRMEHIFPELRESEDERVRKEILEYFQQFENEELRGVNISDWIAWLENIPHTIDKEKREGFLLGYKAGLEKQGEQKETLCDKCRKEQPSHSCQDITALERCALEKQGKKKSVDWNELTWEDINDLETIINEVHSDFRNGIGQKSFGLEVLERFLYNKECEDLDIKSPKFKEGDEIRSIDGQYEDIVLEVLSDGSYRLKNLGLLSIPENEWELANAPVNGYELIDKKEQEGFLNEKQGEQKPQGKSALEAANEEKVDNQNCVKPTDKAEPKFHKDEWITNGDYTWKIIEIKPLDYILQSQDGNIVDDTISHVDEQFHSFTIEDAKPGDVLFAENFDNIGGCVFLFKGLDSWKFDAEGDRAIATGYCCTSITESGNTDFGIQGPDCVEIKRVHPATKEQRDLLFQKMHEAGYMWNEEKKELEKIESTRPMLSDFFNAEYERGKADALQSIEWSEEDEKTLNEIFSVAARASLRKSTLFGKSYDYIKWQNWLKSLKQRHVWKPSEDQIRALHDMNLTGNISYVGQGQTLIELYNDLKKL